MTLIRFADGTTMRSRIVFGLHVLEEHYDSKYDQQHGLRAMMRVRHPATGLWAESKLYDADYTHAGSMSNLTDLWRRRRVQTVQRFCKKLTEISERN